VALVENRYHSLVLGIAGRARLLVARQRFLYVRRQIPPKAVRFRDPERHARRRVGDDNPAESDRMVEGMFHCEHPAPGLDRRPHTGRRCEVPGELGELVF